MGDGPINPQQELTGACEVQGTYSGQEGRLALLSTLLRPTQPTPWSPLLVTCRFETISLESPELRDQATCTSRSLRLRVCAPLYPRPEKKPGEEMTETGITSGLFVLRF